MAKKANRIVKIVLFVSTFLIVAGFALNWYLVNRLENFLRQKLAEEVSMATDGFYSFSFDELSIGLFSGELSMKGIVLEPDSLAFLEWKKGDSLPDTYYNIHLDEIYFKGINLTWSRDYRNLKFSVFELNSPDIRVTRPAFYSDIQSSLDRPVARQSKTLHQMISPYIDILTVKRINLTNANISYIVEDSLSSVIYALKDADFKAYNFLLDKDSYASGKLLYSDDFEFTVGSPQQLLYSNELILNTQNIRLSTKEKLIQIEGVYLHPTEEFWEKRTTDIGDYLKAKVKLVEVKGISFARAKAKNYLNADSFKISSTDITYFNVADDQEKIIKQEDQKIVIEDVWSLYSIISPILNSISIKKINVEDTKLNYTLTHNGYTDIYALDQFNFQANKFLVDSLSDKKKKFWYVDDFILSGDSISGLIPSNNAKVNVARLFLSTVEKRFSLRNAKIEPLDTKLPKDYMQGEIKHIAINGLDYTSGISAEQLRMDTANIQYFKVSRNKQDTQKKKNVNEATEDVLSFLMPYADFLSVEDINLSKVNMSYHDRNAHANYRLRDLNFFATKFLIDEHTRQTSKYLFSFNEIGVSFKDLDVTLPGNDYRLRIKETDLSTLTGQFHLQGIKLIPQENLWAKAPDTYFDIAVNSIRGTGFNYNKYIQASSLDVQSLSINDPHLEVIKSNTSPNIDKEGNDISSLFKNMNIGNLNINRADISYLDKVADDNIQMQLQAFQMKSLKWDVKNKFRIEELILKSPYVTYNEKTKKQQSIASKPSSSPLINSFASSVEVGKFSVSDIKVNVDQPDMSVMATMDKFELAGVNQRIHDKKSLLDFTLIRLVNPYMKIDKSNDGQEQEKDKSKPSPSSEDLYTMLNPYINKLSIKELDIANANLKYDSSLNGKLTESPNINAINLNLNINEFVFDTDERKFNLADIKFNTKDIYFPIDDYYTIGIGNIDLDKKAEKIELSDVRMIPAYSKIDFAYIHPTHADWFDVRVGDITLSGVDYPAYFSDNMLKAKSLVVKDVVLQNFKNKKIYTPPKMQPLIYTKLHDLPVKLVIDDADVFNFSVLYEELPKKGDTAGKIYFDSMNGRFSELTNVAAFPMQYMILDVDGKFMGSPFTGRWSMPVSADYDCFRLEATMRDFDMKALNDIFIPLAGAEIKSGMVNNFAFTTEASSTDANASMLLLYQDLKLSVLKSPDSEDSNGFLTSLANMIIKSNNPNKPTAAPRQANIYIVRDPYHSNFNYFWQILQPAVVESAGISQGKQNFAKGAAGFFSKVKKFFTGDKKKKEAATVAK